MLILRGIVCILAASALALRVVPQDSTSTQSVPAQQMMPNGVVPKCASDAKPIAVFAAGVEGAGHHLLYSMFQKAMKENPADFGTVPRFGYYSMRSAHVNCSKVYALGPEVKKVSWQPLAESYPRGKAAHKPGEDIKAHCPDMISLHEQAVENGFDLRVVFAHRNLAEAFASGCARRGFEPCETYAKTLATATEVLIQQLREWQSDPEKPKPVCFRYGSSKSMKEAVKGVFGEEGAKTVVEDVYSDESHETFKLLDGYEKKEQWLKELSGPNAQLEEECIRMEQMSETSFPRALARVPKKTA